MIQGALRRGWGGSGLGGGGLRRFSGGLRREGRGGILLLEGA